MEALGAVVNIVAIVSQTITIYRHVMASRSFQDIAGTLSAMVLFEYFRFESWAEQSGYLNINHEAGTEITAADKTLHKRDPEAYHKLMIAKAHEVVAHILLTLQELEALFQKYDLDSEVDTKGTAVIGDSGAPPSGLSTIFKSGMALGSKKPVLGATGDIERLRLKLGKETGRLRKIRFGWSVTKETTDRQRLVELIQRLRYWNDGLREILPVRDRTMNNVLTQVRVLGLSENPYVLMGIEHACSQVQSDENGQDQVYQDIRLGAKMKREALQSETEEGDITPTATTSSSTSFDVPVPATSDEPGGSFTILSITDKAKTSKKVIAETVDFNNKMLNEDEDSLLIEQRIKRLAWLLQDDERPESLIIPTSVGYQKEERLKFTLFYEAPASAIASAGYRTLYRMFPRHVNSVGQKAQPPVLPPLEDRIQLARNLATGLLQLHSINWLYKNLNSANLLIFNDSSGLNVTEPMFAGFGLGRPSKPSTKTIDLRAVQLGFEIYQHPELRAVTHRRYERRFDIYSLGVVLFEIGIWQNLHYFRSHDSGPSEFRRRLRNVAETLLPHLMGRTYCQVVVCCIDEDVVWRSAESATELQEGTDGVFYQKVVQELHNCLSKS